MKFSFLFIVLACSHLVFAAEPPSAKRIKLFDLPPPLAKEIPDEQSIECRYCFDICRGLEEEKAHTIAVHGVIIGDVRFNNVRYELPARLRKFIPYRTHYEQKSSSSSDSDDDV